jgi:hypothetical protein
MGVRRNIGELSRDRRKKREIKPTIVIISEGKDTELYLYKW